MKIKHITLDSPIEAEAFRATLADAGIESKTYDETNSKVARGILDKTIDVLVSEEDYAQAIQLLKAFKAGKQDVRPWCPKCGSENVTLREKKHPTFKALPRIIATALTLVLCGASTTFDCRCNDCGHKWER